MNNLVLFTAEWNGFISLAFSYEDSVGASIFLHWGSGKWHFVIDVLSRYRQDMVENTSEETREKS